MSETTCPHCPDGHRRPGSKPMAVMIGPERDSDGQPITLHVQYTNLHHVSEAEAQWLRDLIAEAAGDAVELEAFRVWAAREGVGDLTPHNAAGT
jgi:hypothetical protein